MAESRPSNRQLKEHQSKQTVNRAGKRIQTPATKRGEKPRSGMRFAEMNRSAKLKRRRMLQRFQSSFGSWMKSVSLVLLLSMSFLLSSAYVNPRDSLLAQSVTAFEEFLKDKKFQSEDLMPFIEDADQENDLASWEQIVFDTGLSSLEAAWETEVDAEIQDQLAEITTADNLRTVAEKQNAHASVLEMHKSQAQMEWQRDADDFIQNELEEFLAELITRKERIDEGDLEQAYRRESLGQVENIDHLNGLQEQDTSGYLEQYYDGKEEWERKLANFADKEEDWTKESQQNIAQGLQEWQDAIDALERNKQRYLDRLSDLEASWTLIEEIITQSEVNAKNTIKQSLSQLQNIIKAFENRDASIPESLNYNESKTLITQMLNGLENGGSLSQLATQMKNYWNNEYNSAVTTRNNYYNKIWDYEEATSYSHTIQKVVSKGTEIGTGGNDSKVEYEYIPNFVHTHDDPDTWCTTRNWRDKCTGRATQNKFGYTTDDFVYQAYLNNVKIDHSDNSDRTDYTFIKNIVKLGDETITDTSKFDYDQTYTIISVYQYRDLVIEQNYNTWNQLSSGYLNQSNLWGSYLPSLKDWDEDKENFSSQSASALDAIAQLRAAASSDFDQQVMEMKRLRDQWLWDTSGQSSDQYISDLELAGSNQNSQFNQEKQKWQEKRDDLLDLKAKWFRLAHDRLEENAESQKELAQKLETDLKDEENLSKEDFEDLSSRISSAYQRAGEYQDGVVDSMEELGKQGKLSYLKAELADLFQDSQKWDLQGDLMSQLMQETDTLIADTPDVMQVKSNAQESLLASQEKLKGLWTQLGDQVDQFKDANLLDTTVMDNFTESMMQSLGIAANTILMKQLEQVAFTFEENKKERVRLMSESVLDSLLDESQKNLPGMGYEVFQDGKDMILGKKSIYSGEYILTGKDKTTPDGYKPEMRDQFLYVSVKMPAEFDVTLKTSALSAEDILEKDFNEVYQSFVTIMNGFSEQQQQSQDGYVDTINERMGQPLMDDLELNNEIQIRKEQTYNYAVQQAISRELYDEETFFDSQAFSIISAGLGVVSILTGTVALYAGAMAAVKAYQGYQNGGLGGFALGAISGIASAYTGSAYGFGIDLSYSYEDGFGVGASVGYSGVQVGIDATLGHDLTNVKNFRANEANVSYEGKYGNAGLAWSRDGGYGFSASGNYKGYNAGFEASLGHDLSDIKKWGIEEYNAGYSKQGKNGSYNGTISFDRDGNYKGAHANVSGNIDGAKVSYGFSHSNQGYSFAQNIGQDYKSSYGTVNSSTTNTFNFSNSGELQSTSTDTVNRIDNINTQQIDNLLGSAWDTVSDAISDTYYAATELLTPDDNVTSPPAEDAGTSDQPFGDPALVSKETSGQKEEDLIPGESESDPDSSIANNNGETDGSEWDDIGLNLDSLSPEERARAEALLAEQGKTVDASGGYYGGGQDSDENLSSTEALILSTQAIDLTKYLPVLPATALRFMGTFGALMSIPGSERVNNSGTTLDQPQDVDTGATAFPDGTTTLPNDVPGYETDQNQKDSTTGPYQPDSNNWWDFTSPYPIPNEDTNNIIEANGDEVIQTGGHTLTKSTLNELGLTKEEGKKAIESMKKDLLLPNDFHGKITKNGNVLDSETGKVLGNLFDYLY